MMSPINSATSKIKLSGNWFRTITDAGNLYKMRRGIQGFNVRRPFAQERTSARFSSAFSGFLLLVVRYAMMSRMF